MEPPATIDAYLRAFSNELGERILESFPPLHGPQEPPSPLLTHLLRRPYPGQNLAIMGVVERLAQACSAAVVAECGTGKTLIGRSQPSNNLSPRGREWSPRWSGRLSCGLI